MSQDLQTRSPGDLVRTVSQLAIGDLRSFCKLMEVLVLPISGSSS